MKLSFRMNTALISAVALLVFSSAAFAVCQRNNCAELRDQCVDNGGSGCELKYYRCLRANGCPIP